MNRFSWRFGEALATGDEPRPEGIRSTFCGHPPPGSEEEGQGEDHPRRTWRRERRAPFRAGPGPAQPNSICESSGDVLEARAADMECQDAGAQALRAGDGPCRPSGCRGRPRRRSDARIGDAVAPEDVERKGVVCESHPDRPHDRQRDDMKQQNYEQQVISCRGLTRESGSRSGGACARTDRLMRGFAVEGGDHQRGATRSTPATPPTADQAESRRRIDRLGGKCADEQRDVERTTGTASRRSPRDRRE